MLICLCWSILMSLLSPSGQGFWSVPGTRASGKAKAGLQQIPRPLLYHLSLSLPAPLGKLSSQKVSASCLRKIHSDKDFSPDKASSLHLWWNSPEKLLPMCALMTQLPPRLTSLLAKNYKKTQFPWGHFVPWIFSIRTESNLIWAPRSTTLFRRYLGGRGTSLRLWFN